MREGCWGAGACVVGEKLGGVRCVCEGGAREMRKETARKRSNAGG